MELDLDKHREVRAAESEAKGETHTVILGGERFTLPTEIPFGFTDVIRGATDIEGSQRFFRTLLGSDQYERFLAHRPTWDELDLIVKELFEAWGITQGESSASNGSSENGSRPSKRTSTGTTGSTSAKRSGAKKR